MVAHSKGAPEVVLEGCGLQLRDDGEHVLEPADRERILETARQMASQALRVLAVASKARAGLEDAESAVFNDPFGTFPLPLRDWVIVVAAAFTVSPVLELAKWMERRGWLGSLGS